MSKITELNSDLYGNKIISARALQLKAKEVAKEFSPKLENSIKVRLDSKTMLFFKEGTDSKIVESKVQKFINAKTKNQIVYFNE
jgi:hypothetical protein